MDISWFLYMQLLSLVLSSDRWKDVTVTASDFAELWADRGRSQVITLGVGKKPLAIPFHTLPKEQYCLMGCHSGTYA